MDVTRDPDKRKRAYVNIFRHLILGFSFSLLATLAAASPRQVSVMVRPLQSQERRIPSDALHEADARVLAEYPDMQAISLPDQALNVIERRLAGRFELEALPEGIHTPRFTIPRGALPPASPFASGLFILQFVAPATPEWQAILADSGIEVIERVPERSVIIAATEAEIAVLGQFRWVEYVGPYLAKYKFGPHAALGQADFTVSIADTHRTVDDVAALAARVGGFLAVSRHDNQLTAQIRTDVATATALLDHSYVLGVEATVPLQSSDERQALGVTGPITTPGAANTTYLNWLAAAPRYITPNALTNSGIVVDVADSGVDQGCYMLDEHQDLEGRGAYFKNPTSPYTFDVSGHATVVATIIGGNPGAGIRYNQTGTPTNGLGHKDNDSYGQFYYGLGVAPGIRIGSTRVMGSGGFYSAASVTQWTTIASTSMCNTPADVCVDSANLCGATVQNVSSNEYDQTGSAAGVYTARAREFDISVRNADRSTMRPLAVTLSAGNYRQIQKADGSYESSTEVLAPATAKNAISVGSAESARDSIAACNTVLTQGDNPSLRVSVYRSRL